MRTTVTLDADVALKIRQIMRDRGISMKEAINSLIRTGLSPSRAKPRKIRTPTYNMGPLPSAFQNKMGALSDAIEDEEIVRKLSLGK
jgi:hypothetical protein